jgi:DNA-binding beta-propeller fold protein YncE
MPMASRHLPLAALGCLLLLAGPACGSAQVPSPEPATVIPIPHSLLYVCVQDDARIAVVDMEEMRVLETISLVDLGFGEGAMPHDVAVDPDGSHWYVSLIGENRVVRLNERNQREGDVRFEAPGMVEVHPRGGLLLVTRSMSAVDPPSRIGIVEDSPWEAREVELLFPRPHGIAVDPEGRYAYTASLAENQLATIDLRSQRVQFTPVPGPIHALVQFAVSPDGRTLVASGELSGQLLVFTLEDRTRPSLVMSVPVGLQPFDPLFAPDGRTVWVPIKGSNEIAVVETEGWRVVDRLSGDAILQPHALAFSPDGRRVFVTNNNKSAHAMDMGVGGADEGVEASLVVIDAETRTIEGAIPLGRNLTGLGSRQAP